tara:strand:+ start:860 stop:1213 length:354 start_codon:yes stop_codon:yes gene_type:complete
MAARWDISNCEDWKVKDGREKVIFKLHWNCADDREYPNPDPEGDPLVAYGSIRGTCVLDIGDIQDFTAYDQVTKEQALGWLYSVMTVEQKAKSEIHVEQQILNQIDPPTESGLPWGE